MSAAPRTGAGVDRFPEPLPMENGLYYRWHPYARPFGREHASTVPFIPDGLEGTVADRYREPRPGFSCFWNPHHLAQYLAAMHWTPDPAEGCVLVFYGEPVGEGYDGEPRVLPSSEILERISWDEFEFRLELSSDGYGRWDEHTWGDGPEGKIADDGYRTLAQLG